MARKTNPKTTGIQPVEKASCNQLILALMVICLIVTRDKFQEMYLFNYSGILPDDMSRNSSYQYMMICSREITKSCLLFF